ncbi:hypothetical protein [Desulforhopalus sp. IMCC35007]|uniref:hypothetical protein n=1 Tax=Desulforhopalus sp. IMCC35007 TaxID=2569543 RepID=UPI001F0EB7E4|nr:hypothetical protein [Desulforhopalus sp. IMCC35007]
MFQSNAHAPEGNFANVVKNSGRSFTRFSKNIGGRIYIVCNKEGFFLTRGWSKVSKQYKHANRADSRYQSFQLKTSFSLRLSLSICPEETPYENYSNGPLLGWVPLQDGRFISIGVPSRSTSASFNMAMLTWSGPVPVFP